MLHVMIFFPFPSRLFCVQILNLIIKLSILPFKMKYNMDILGAMVTLQV